MANSNTFELLGETFQEEYRLRSVLFSLFVLIGIALIWTFLMAIMKVRDDVAFLYFVCLLTPAAHVVITFLLPKREMQSDKHLKLSLQALIPTAIGIVLALLVTNHAIKAQADIIMITIVVVGCALLGLTLLFLSTLFWQLEYQKYSPNK